MTWFKADIRTTTNIQCHTNLNLNFDPLFKAVYSLLVIVDVLKVIG